MELIDELMEVKHLNINDIDFTNRVRDYMFRRKQNYRFELEGSQLLMNFVYHETNINYRHDISTFGFVTNYNLLFIISILYEPCVLNFVDVKTYYVNTDAEKVITEMERMMNNHNCYSYDLVRLCNKYMDICNDEVIFASLMPRMTKSSHSLTKSSCSN